MKSVFINGMGLIGASLTRIIKTNNPNLEVIAHDLNSNNITFMLKNGLIDGETIFEDGARKADLIILATPVKQIIKDLTKLATIPLKPNVLVTDVGSNKERILQAAKPLMANGNNFLGGHPMAGSHLSGSNHSSIQMLKKHTYFLVNGNATDKQINSFKSLLSPAKFQFNSLNSIQHDQLVSATSHLPHLVAFTLINTITPEVNKMKIDPGIPSGGLLDTTRIAQANADMWSSIMTTEKSDLLKQINQFEDQLNEMKVAIKNKDQIKLKEKIQEANQARRKLADRK